MAVEPRPMEFAQIAPHNQLGSFRELDAPRERVGERATLQV